MAQLFRAPALRRTLLVCTTLQMCQQLSGINAIVYYTPQAGHSIYIKGYIYGQVSSTRYVR